ncbi:thiol peroxidase [Salmonella enterica subsp. enterica]|uniref:Thiol peroxidase n=1 Tax=Salmonella enterica I TaxID=59201 RepID=A0A3S4HVX1_SALET|nr:thiol peroxidase [Salmonella enterica subsp. enterica]
MSQTVHFQGNPVTVANVIPQAGSKAQAFYSCRKRFV